MGNSEKASGLTFMIEKSKGWKYYKIHQEDKNGPVVYHAEIHNWTPKKPSVELRQGDSQTGPMVAFARIDSGGCKSHLALGDPAVVKDTNIVSYDGMATTSAFSFKEYTFETDELNEKRQHRQYTWIRTQHHPGRFECRDVQTGEVLSEFLSNGMMKWTKIGHVTVTQPHLSQRAIEYLLLVFLTWSEMENREQAVLAAIVK